MEGKRTVIERGRLVGRLLQPSKQKKKVDWSKVVAAEDMRSSQMQDIWGWPSQVLILLSEKVQDEKRKRGTRRTPRFLD